MLIMKNEKIGISPVDMKDGQIGVIVSWPISHHIGQVVQRYGNVLITLGRDSGFTFSSVCDKRYKENCPNGLVSILENGTLLEVRNNE